MIILNEKKYIESVIEKKEVSSKPSETINLMVKYYKSLKVEKGEVYNLIHEYFLQNYKPYNKVKWEDTINKYVDVIYKKDYKLVNIEFIPVTDKEIAKINSLKSKRLERLAFTMLVIAKMNNMVDEKNNGWVNKKDKEIFKLANIAGKPIKTQCLLLNDLENKGFIEFSKRVDNTNNRVLYIQDGETVLKVADLRNLGYVYESFMGTGSFKKCERCEDIIKITTSNNKYCNCCSVKINREKQKTRDEKRKILKPV